MVTLPDERDLSYWQAIRRGSPVHWLAPILIVVGPAVAWFANEDVYWFFMREDRVVEWATFVAYALGMVVAAVVAVLLARRRLRLEACMWAGAALFLLVFAGEEISWGERVLGYTPPEAIVSQNQQNEGNLHNLLGRHALHGGYIVMGLFFAFGLRLLVPRIRPLARRAWLYVPPKVLTPWFLAVTVYYFILDYPDELWHAVFGTRPLDQIDRLQEAPELVFAIGLLLTTVMVLGSIQAGWLDRRALEAEAPTADLTA